MTKTTIGILLRAIVAALLAISQASAPAATIEGQRFDDVARVGDGRVVLNGVGVRAAGWFKVYVAGLYLAARSNDPDAIYAAPGPKRIAVRLLVDASPELLAKTFDDGIRKNYKGDAIDALKPQMDAFDAQVRAIAGGAKKGQSVDLDFDPATGTRVRVAGKPIGDAIPGDAFYVALLKMFIGERAVDKSLRAALLGRG